ncbi:MAG: hypothetical protein AB7Y46_04275 [Armatimonadota bacterium]
MSQMLRMDWRVTFILTAWMLMVLGPLLLVRMLVAPQVGQVQWLGICVGCFLTVTLPRSFMLLMHGREAAVPLRPRWAQLKWDLAIVFLTAAFVSSFPPVGGWRSLAQLMVAIVAVAALVGPLVVRRQAAQQLRPLHREIANFREAAK